VDGQRLIEATRAALAADAALLSGDEKAKIESSLANLEKLVSTADHRKIKQAIEGLNRATDDFAARRMDAGIKRALSGRKIGSL
jgi:molecular chaperone HscA